MAVISYITGSACAMSHVSSANCDTTLTLLDAHPSYKMQAGGQMPVFMMTE